MKTRSPIPSPKNEDQEDVSWALLTAEAMWGRGERNDALKWLRRAAEAASEAEDDERALELAKAAAEMATMLGDAKPRAPAPSAVTEPRAKMPSMSGERARQAASAQEAKGPSSSTPTELRVASGRGAPGPSPLAVKPGAAVATKPAGMGPRPPAAQPSKRASRASFATEAKTGENPPAPRSRAASISDAKKKSRNGKPLLEMPPPPDQGQEESTASASSDIDAWPTEVVAGEQLEARALSRRSAADANVAGAHQAFAVVVWRDGDQLCVGKIGSRPGAPALLVSLEPGEELAALLVPK